MFQGWRFKIREAEQALREGRLEDAGKILANAELLQYLPAQRLRAKVASRLADRSTKHIAAGDWMLGWTDFEKSRQLGGASQGWHTARKWIIKVAVREIEQDLQELNPVRAISRVEELRKRDCANDQVRALEELARRIQSANNLVRKGRFDDALNQLAYAQKMRPKLESLNTLKSTLQNKGSQCQVLTEQLRKAVSEDRWTDAVNFADQILKMSPENRLALDTRQHAWKQVDNPRTDLRSTESRPWGFGETQVATAQRGATETESEPVDRFLLWVDAVGGFLVCLQDEVTLGQALPNQKQVQIPIRADLARQHATIKREGDAYLLRPLGGAVQIGGKVVRETNLLTDGDDIELGDGVVLRFRKPHALSASARLDFISRHKTQPTADGILLMAESCVLGPKWQNHVVCRDWSGDVVLFRHGDELFCRAMESIEIDGELCDGKGRIRPDSRVSGIDFSMSLEEI